MPRKQQRDEGRNRTRIASRSAESTSGLPAAQDNLLEAVRLAASRHDILGEAGRDPSGRVVFLAREHSSAIVPASAHTADRLTVILASSIEPGSAPEIASVRLLEIASIAISPECYGCGAPRLDEARYCDECGATLEVILPPAALDASPADRRRALETATRGRLTMLGAMDGREGLEVVFARDAESDGLLLALIPRAGRFAENDRARTVLASICAIDAIEQSLRAEHGTAERTHQSDDGGVSLSASPRPNENPAPKNSPGAEAIEASTDDWNERLIGTLVDGKYRIIRTLGQGGMGCVFEAQHVTLGVRRAIKVMHERLQASDDLVRRFKEEARNAARVTHEHVCAIVDFGASERLLYIVMEFLDGESLATLLKREKTLPVQRVARIVAQTAAALDAAHALTIIHRDVKPDNIMLCRSADGLDHVKVVDFGISKALNRSEVTAAEVGTKHGVVMGTRPFMSIEQQLGEEVDHRTDIYALGRTALLAFAGDLPEHSKWESWSSGHVDPALRPVLSRAFAPQAARYATAGAFSRDLQLAVAEIAPATPRRVRWRDGWRQRWDGMHGIRRRPVLALAGVLAVVLLIASARVGAAFLTGERIAVEPIRASPPSVSFEVVEGVVRPATSEVRIEPIAPGEVRGLDVGVRYEGASTGWLEHPVWRAGTDTTSRSLVLRTNVSDMAPGTYRASVSVGSPSDGRGIAAIPVTLTVTAPNDCDTPQAELARLGALTDPLTGTRRGAREALAVVPDLMPRLCSAAERVEAQLRLAEARIALGQHAQSCEVLRRIEKESETTPFADNVRLYLTSCPKAATRARERATDEGTRVQGVRVARRLTAWTRRPVRKDQ